MKKPKFTHVLSEHKGVSYKVYKECNEWVAKEERGVIRRFSVKNNLNVIYTLDEWNKKRR